MNVYTPEEVERINKLKETNDRLEEFFNNKRAEWSKLIEPLFEILKLEINSQTSKQIMELIQVISKDRLVIMVTHNAEIAHTYSDRIITLVDGLVVEDSNPAPEQKNDTSVKMINKKTSMSFLTAIKTSFKNLLTKRGRTIITSLAGSIGIIGIALVLAISTGMTS